MIRQLFWIPAACLTLAACDRPVSSTPPVESTTRVYALDCGRIEIDDAGLISESGKPAGKSLTMADPCILVRHRGGTLLWDTGLPWSASRTKEGFANPVGREFIDAPLPEQLKALSLAPGDITFVGFSHLHYDHTGNANLFTSSTWLLNRKELDWALHTTHPFIDPATFSARTKVKLELLDADRDVFGDGTVRILQTPGHTPGHQSLVVKLAHTGTLVFSGDLAHSRENWEKQVIPPFDDRAPTAASMARVAALLAETHGRMVVQHDPADFHALPTFPSYLE